MNSDLFSDEYTMLRLMQIQDDKTRERYRAFLAHMAPYKSAVLWPEWLLAAPMTDGVRCVFCVGGELTVVQFSFMGVPRYNGKGYGTERVDDPDVIHDAVFGGDLFELVGYVGDRTRITFCDYWNEFLNCVERKKGVAMFFDMADALRYQRYRWSRYP